MNSRPDLTDEEIDGICAGYRQNHAKIRFLRSLGLRVDKRPNGHPLVARSEWERRNDQKVTAVPRSTSSNGPTWSVAA